MTTLQKIKLRTQKTKSFLSVGLDSNFNRLPTRFIRKKDPQFEFNKWIIENTNQYALAYKINFAFYEARGSQGWQELSQTIAYLKKLYPDIVTIADAKRGDIGSSNEGYVQAIFNDLGFDSVTVHPYLGAAALEPFLKRKDKLIIVLAKTSNRDSGEFQDLKLGPQPLWLQVIEQVQDEWNYFGNCGLVMGATYPRQLAQARQKAPQLPFLVPGIGQQGGDLKAVLNNGLTPKKGGLIINSSRGIIFAENPAKEAKKLQLTMKQVF